MKTAKKKTWKRGGQLLKEKLSKKDLSLHFSEMAKKREAKRRMMKDFYDKNHKAK